MVQWLGLRDLNAKVTGLIPSLGTKILQVMWHGKKIRLKIHLLFWCSTNHFPLNTCGNHNSKNLECIIFLTVNKSTFASKYSNHLWIFLWISKVIMNYLENVFLWITFISYNIAFNNISDLHNGVFHMVNSYSLYSSLTTLKTFLINKIIGIGV